jgi:TRAP-type C4-dicarboxylate transport system substrate-binding protein
MKRLVRILFVLCLVSLFATPALAFRELSVVATWSNLTLWQKLEQPFWNDILPKASGGQLKAKVVGTLDQINTPGTGLLRQMDDGIFDVVVVCTDYVVSDCGALAGLDLPVMAPDIKSAQKIVDAYRPALDDLFKKYFNAKVLAVCPYPYQILFTNFPMKDGLKSLSGKKIRASGWTTAKFIDALGGTGVTMPFGEVPQSLSRGVVDGAITGSLSGYSAKWHEVTKYLSPLPLGGWDYYVTAINYDVWQEMSPKEQKMFTDLIKKNLERPAWAQAGQEAQMGVDILTGTGTYKGKAAYMELQKVTPEDIKLAKKILQESVLPAFAKQIKPEEAKQWNETIGKVVGLKIDL